MTRNLPAAVALAAALAGGAIAAAGLTKPPRITVEGPVLRFRSGDLLYRYHATYRVETLFDVGTDPYETRDLAAARPADLAALRAAFLKRLGRPDLESIPASGQEWKDYATGLGYR